MGRRRSFCHGPLFCNLLYHSVGFNPDVELCLKCRKEEGVPFECVLCGGEIIKGVDEIINIENGKWMDMNCIIETLEENDYLWGEIIYDNNKVVEFNEDQDLEERIKIGFKTIGQKFLNYLISKLLKIADNYYDKEVFEEVKKIYKVILKFNPDDIKALEGLGSVYCDTKNYSKSISYYNKALEIDPDDEKLWEYIGIAYENNKEKVKAKEAYERANFFKK